MNYIYRMDSIKSHDIVVLLKVLCKGAKGWKYESLEQELSMSKSAIFRSLNRCAGARFISQKPYTQFYAKNVLEFLLHGVQYVFATEPGKVTRGIATAHSAPPLKELILSQNEVYVWPYAKGKERGQAIEPLTDAIAAVEGDTDLYQLLTLIDAIRIGKVREKQAAAELLTQQISQYAAHY